MAKFNSTWLISKRQFRTLTGVDAAAFRELAKRFLPHLQDRIFNPKNRFGRPWGMGGHEDHLLVLLILYRCAITQDCMAWVSNGPSVFPMKKPLRTKDGSTAFPSQPPG